MSIIMNGKELSNRLASEMKREVDGLKSKNCFPELLIITNPHDPASKTYVRNKVKMCNEIGIRVEQMSHEIVDQALLNYIKDRNCPTIIQMPCKFAEGITDEILSEYILPENDVDGFASFQNVANLANGLVPFNLPCTPFGISILLYEYDVQLKNKKVVVIGRSNIVGRPIARILEHQNATVSVCHTGTGRELLKSEIKSADILISATGNPELLAELFPDMKSIDGFNFDNKILIDVGIVRNNEGKIQGDIPKILTDNCYAYTPVPGGVGPMTVSMLCKNVINKYEREF